MADATIGPADTALTLRVKDYALRTLNADLVGVANIERFAHAPPRMSPQGILPSARSVVVMAVHHGDACIELGGQRHPQDIGPYRLQYDMNYFLDAMSYRLGLFLEDAGFRAVPIVSSNIWRYKGYKDLSEQFAPDLSHLHAAVAAGLAEFGYSGLAITPEFGARQRYISVITDAPLTPSPLREPGSVCDHCMLCSRHCRSGALTKELDGWNVVRIEDKEYRYARKNLWRCAWGEHFDLDLDLPIPDRVDEAVILEAVARHGLRGGEMGSCLRHCLPRDLRTFDRSYSSAPRRRRPPPLPVDRVWLERVRSLPGRHGADAVVIRSADQMRQAGFDIAAHLPGAQSAVIVAAGEGRSHTADGAADRAELDKAAGEVTAWGAYDVARELERAGYDALMMTDLPEPAVAALLPPSPEGAWRTETVLTTAQLPPTALPTPLDVVAADGRTLAASLERLAAQAGADLFGLADAAALADVAEQLRPIFQAQTVFDLADHAERFRAPRPEVTARRRVIHTPADHLRGAATVLVAGLRLPRATVDVTTRTVAEAIGPYAFAQYESVRLLRTVAWRLARRLEQAGYRAVWSFDLLGDGGQVANPRGLQPDAFCNRFPAVAAGLGRLSLCGAVVTPRFGSNVRFVALVTDAKLGAAGPRPAEPLDGRCGDCTRCLDACRTGAFAEPVTVRVGPVVERFRPILQDRCDWAKRYSLVAAEGNQFLGWKLDEAPPAQITAEALAAAYAKAPAIPKYRPCNAERCLLACPYAR